MTRTRTAEGHIVIVRRKDGMIEAIAKANTMQEFLTAVGQGEHNDCKWVKVGRCVYCDDHNVRLYDGEIPADKK